MSFLHAMSLVPSPKPGYIFERRDTNGAGRGSFARALMALNEGALASFVSWKRAISCVHRNAPASRHGEKRDMSLMCAGVLCNSLRKP